MMAYILAFSLSFMTSNTDIISLVEDYHQIKTKEAELNFIHKHGKSEDPSVLAYVVSLSMKQAEYSYNPYRKLQIFNANRKRLNQLIEQNADNINLRYVRLVAQENAPGFLGYNDFINEDKIFLSKKLSIKDSTDYLDPYIKANTSL